MSGGGWWKHHREAFVFGFAGFVVASLVQLFAIILG